MDKKNDPIILAKKATNKGNALKKANRIYRQSWQSRSDETIQRRFRDEHWKSCIKSLRTTFRNQFRKKAFKGLSIEWHGKGYAENGITRKIEPWLSYTAHFKGMQFSRHFSPECREDVIAEAWKLGGALIGWVE